MERGMTCYLRAVQHFVTFEVYSLESDVTGKKIHYSFDRQFYDNLSIDIQALFPLL